MMYILTKDELDDFRKKVESKQEIINLLCQDISDKVPIVKDHGDETPHGCIHSKRFDWYCDDCIVEEYCEMDKRFSK